MQLKDGKGSGNLVEINNDYMVRCESFSSGRASFVCGEHGKSFAFTIEGVTPTGAGDFFCYILNNSDDNIVVTELDLWTTTAEYVDIYLGMTGTAAGITLENPGNKNAGSSKIADATVAYGADITGLSGGSVVGRLRMPIAGVTKKHVWKSGFVIPKNKTFALMAGAGAIVLDAIVHFYFLSKIK